MAKDTRHRTTLGNWFRFFIRFLGLTGVVAAAAGAFVLFSTAAAVPTSFEAAWPFLKATVPPAIEGAKGPGQQAAGLAFVLGLAAAAVWLVVEMFSILFLGTGRRTLTGTTSTVQVAIALFLLLAVNIYSFSHYLRLDLTRSNEFTLPPSVSKELRTLDTESPTTIVVLQKHQTFATLAGKQDSYDTAADGKVVEKVRDLVDQFRELGGRFKVVSLDVNEKRFDQRLAAETEGMPQLKAAIASAPESSIFFASGDRVQRLSFSDFLQLDKTGSKEANAGRGNLVLREQGVDGFARRILAIQEKRPKVALAVIHEVLTTDAADEDDDPYTAAGLKKTLSDYGFDVIDIVLKKWDGEGEPPPAAYLLAESKLERLEAELKIAQDELNDSTLELQALTKALERIALVKDKPFPVRNALYAQIFGGPLNPRIEAEVLESLPRQVEQLKKILPDLEKEQQAADERLEAISADERAIEGKRQQDVKAKFAKLLADVDLLIIPRLTVFNATTGASVPPRLYRFSRDQSSVVKDFMKTGKPVLACTGPISTRVRRTPNETAEAYAKRIDTTLGEASDDLERLLAERGVELGRDTIVFNAESKAFATRQAGQQFGGGKIEIPAVHFDSVGEDSNPVAEALKTTGRSIGQPLDIRLRALRPVYLIPAWKDRVPFAAEFVVTSADAWNEKRPFPDLDVKDDGTATLYIPKYDAGKAPSKGGDRDTERRGPFPIGVAIRSKLPAYWFDERLEPARLAAVAVTGSTLGGAALTADLLDQADRLEGPESRLVVLGHGGVFTGQDLKPAQQKLLLHSLNWLLGRSDRLPRSDAETWQYPRVNLTERQFALWRWGTFLGLPLIAIYAGLIVLMIRKVR